MTNEVKFKAKIKKAIVPSLADERQYVIWFHTPINLLFNCSPNQLCSTKFGRDKLRDYLARAGIRV